MLATATLTLRRDEPAWSLREVNLPTPDSRGRHRYQIIEVVRSDKLVEWRKDLGDAANFSAQQFQIMGGFVDERGKGHVYESVASLQDIADDMREEPDRPEAMKTEAQWSQAYHDERDRRKRKAVGRRVFPVGVPS